MAKIEVIRQDITTLAVDAIVNAAAPELLGGGGVDGAIHRAAGRELLAACAKLHGCAVGSAKATPGFQLPAKWVFHAVGPIWTGGDRGEDEALAGCYRRCLVLAREHGVKTIAFSAISTGVYGFPKERAARIAVKTVMEEVETSEVERVVFCCFSDQAVSIYEQLTGVESGREV